MIDSCHSHSNRPQQPIGTIMLKHCTTNRAELIPRDICARPNTFELRLVAQRNVDQDSLTTTVPATSGGDLCSTRSVHAQTPLAPSVRKPLKPRGNLFPPIPHSHFCRFPTGIGCLRIQSKIALFGATN